MFTFNEFQESHLPLLRSWLQKNHVKKYWQETGSGEELKEKFLNKNPGRGVHSFIVGRQGNSIGYIQYYEASQVGGGWWPLEQPGSFGMDLLIGSVEAVGQGLGPSIVTEFISLLRSKEARLKSVIVDPHPQNTFAIRAFEKAGFWREKELSTPGGTALLMRMKIGD